MCNKTYDIEYRILLNFIYDSFKYNTKDSYINTAEGTLDNSKEAFKDELFIKMLKEYCDNIKCNMEFDFMENTNDVRVKFELCKNSKYYFGEVK